MIQYRILHIKYYTMLNMNPNTDPNTRLKEAHDLEDTYNKEMSKIDKQVRHLMRRKQKLAKLISKNMKYRNSLIKFGAILK